ncbi:MAG: hypothetical protein FJ242_07745 [Nitrospira sp.]|nr:hypothetical protein [Nitrospira sp.]
MPIFLTKTILSIVLLLITFLAMLTMFEALGRSEKKFNVSKLMKVHRFNGKIYFVLYLIIAYFCIDFMVKTKAELSPRATMHAVFALTIIMFLLLKISFVRIYKQFYGQVKTIGLLIALITFGMVGTSGGYYLIITKFGTEKTFYKVTDYKEEITQKGIIVKTDAESIRKGKEIYENKCSFCHDPPMEQILL